LLVGDEEEDSVSGRGFWTRAWIQRWRQFGLYDQLVVKVRREDPYSFKNFMRMPCMTKCDGQLQTKLEGLSIPRVLFGDPAISSRTSPVACA